MAKAKTTKKKAATKKTSAKGQSSSKAATKKKAKKKSTATKKKASTRKSAGDTVVKVDRRKPKTERRRSPELEEILNAELDAAPQVDRRKTSRRRQIDPTTCERDYNGEEIEFMHALDEYKRAAGRMFPTCSEILEVVRGLGYYRLTPDQMAVLGIGAQGEEAAEQSDDEGANATDGNANAADDAESTSALGEVHAAEELSSSIRATQSLPTSTFAPAQFSAEQLVGDDFAGSDDY